MAVKSRDYKGEALLDFEWDKIMRSITTVDALTVVWGLIKDFNNRLPDGFEVKLHPKGSDIEKQIKG